MQWHAEVFQKRFGTPCVFEFDREELPIGKEAGTALFRIFQEALTNVARHSQATEVRATIEQKGSALCLLIKDNGVGFDATAGSGRESFGLIGMKERTHILGGEFNLETMPDQGTRIEIRIPTDKGGQRS
jgi:signal transduction histidine kinase